MKGAVVKNENDYTDEICLNININEKLIKK